MCAFSPLPSHPTTASDFRLVVWAVGSPQEGFLNERPHCLPHVTPRTHLTAHHRLSRPCHQSESLDLSLMFRSSKPCYLKIPVPHLPQLLSSGPHYEAAAEHIPCASSDARMLLGTSLLWPCSLLMLSWSHLCLLLTLCFFSAHHPSGWLPSVTPVILGFLLLTSFLASMCIICF